jgi:membrane-associated phospholipid phosphatase
LVYLAGKPSGVLRRASYLDPMTFVTDFADQAVVLPLIATVALSLGILGWRRGAVGWLAAVGASFASVVVLKLGFLDCADAVGLPVLRSPSGHTAAAAVIVGGFTVMLGCGRPTTLAAAVLGALVIGATRMALGVHSLLEVIVGGAVGVAGALGFAIIAGRAPRLRLQWVFASVAMVALLLHGRHLDAEPRIRLVAFSLPFCSADHVRP